MKRIWLAVFAVSTLMVACEKDRDDSMRDYLQGEWRLVRMGVDANQNGIFESSEMVNTPDSGLATTVFRGDGSGFSAIHVGGYSVDAAFTWTANDHEQTLTQVYPDSLTVKSGFTVEDVHHFHLIAPMAQGVTMMMVYSRTRN